MSKKSKLKPKSKRKTQSSNPNSSLFQPLQVVDPRLYTTAQAPDVGITAPYEYKPTEEKPPYTRDASNISGSWTETYTGSKTETTLIGTIGNDCILQNYNLSAVIASGTIPDYQRFSLRILRGGNTIFIVHVDLASTGAQQSVASNANIVLKEGDVINLVSQPKNVTNMLYYAFCSLMLQPYR